MPKTVHRFKYWIEESGGNAENSYEYEHHSFGSLGAQEDLDYIAECIAEEYHGDHDGWEAHWPITFTIADESGAVFKYEIERETRPHFLARLVK